MAETSLALASEVSNCGKLEPGRGGQGLLPPLISLEPRPSLPRFYLAAVEKKQNLGKEGLGSRLPSNTSTLYF